MVMSWSEIYVSGLAVIGVEAFLRESSLSMHFPA
jgi:hypothetical protein